MRKFNATLCGIGAILALGGAAVYADDTPATPPPPAITPAPIPPTQVPPTTPPPATPAPSTAPPTNTPPPNLYPPPPPPPDQVEPQISQAQLNAKGIHANMPAQIAVSGVAGRVNGHTITNQELVERFLRDGGQSTLNEMITGELVQEAANKAHVTASHAEIMAKYVEFKKEVLKNSPPGFTWTQILSAEGRSEEYALEQVKLRILLEKLVSGRVPPVSLAGKIHIYHILIATVPLPPEHQVAHTDADAKAKIESIAADIKAGKLTFKQAASQYSEDESTKSSGGDLGWVGRERNLDAKFAAAAFALKEGEVSGPVQSQYGWHLIYLEKLGENAPRSELKKMHDDQVKAEATQLITQYVRELRDSATIEKPLMPGVAIPNPAARPLMFPGQPRPAAPAKPAKPVKPTAPTVHHQGH